MKKALPVVLTLLLGTASQAGCMYPYISETEPTQITETLEEKAGEQKPWETPKEFYDNLEYKDFSKIDFDRLPKEEIELPDKFKKHVLNPPTNWSFEDYSRFEDEVLALAKKQLPKGLENASAKECLVAAMQIVMDKVEYKEDKENKDLCDKRKYDLFFYDGTGDCDDYTKLFCEVFKVIKKHNSNCDNVYVTKEIGGDLEKHAWNSIWLAYQKNHLVTTQVDITFCDRDAAELEATDYHTRKNGNKIKMMLAANMVDLDVALEFLEKEYPNVMSSQLEELIYKKSVWSSILYSSLLDKKSKANEQDKAKYFKNIMDALQDAKGMYMWRDKYSMILRNAICAYRAVGVTVLADELMGEYEKKFPHKPFEVPPPWE